MDGTLYLERAENELELAKILFRITDEKAIQEDVFRIRQPLTFYSAVITHSHYDLHGQEPPPGTLTD